MGRAIRFAAIIAALYLSTIIAAEDYIPSKACSCYTATTWVADNGCPAFKPTPPCIVPLCVMLSVTTIPGPDKRCPKTPTLTSYLPCQTACRHGCATSTSTLTASSSCHPSIPTAKSTTPSKSTLIPSTIDTTPSTTPPSHSRPCFTSYVTASSKCPEDEPNCPPPDCIWLSTTIVPSGPVEGCEKTETVTRSRVCKGCGACGTQWVTETATAWGA